MEPIRRAAPADVSRIAEILVFNNRLYFWPIFQDDGYSFGEMQVLPVAESYLKDPQKLADTFVYDDGVVKGLIQAAGGEVVKCYVAPCFQSGGVGRALLDYAVKRLDARWLWALERNRRAIRFYERAGFHATGERKLEEGTPEYLTRMERD